MASKGLRFVSENGKSSTARTRVACVGDSITELTNYTNYLSDKLGSNYAVGNFGACGSKISLDSDNPYLYSDAFKDATEFQPTIVMIMLGTNDASLSLEHTRGDFVEDYLTLVKNFQSLESKPQVWIVKPPPILDENMGLSTYDFNQEIIPAFEVVAARANLPLIDVYSALQNPSYFTDGVHPNEEGAKLIAEVVYRALTSN